MKRAVKKQEALFGGGKEPEKPVSRADFWRTYAGMKT